MAGHSKWHNIKNKKEATDSKKAKIFGLLSKQIRIVVREAGTADPQFSPNLRVLLDKARAANMPKHKIQAALDHGLGKTSAGVVYQEILYEGFGPGGVGVLIECLTDNLNRLSSEIKQAFSRHGGSIGAPGSVRYLFERRGSEFVPLMQYPVEPAALAQMRELIDAIHEVEGVEDVFTSVEVPEVAEEED